MYFRLSKPKRYLTGAVIVGIIVAVSYYLKFQLNVSYD